MDQSVVNSHWLSPNFGIYRISSCLTNYLQKAIPDYNGTDE